MPRVVFQLGKVVGRVEGIAAGLAIIDELTEIACLPRGVEDNSERSNNQGSHAPTACTSEHACAVILQRKRHPVSAAFVRAEEHLGRPDHVFGQVNRAPNGTDLISGVRSELVGSCAERRG